MLRHKTNVLFLDTDGKRKKPVQVPTKLVLHWKKYMFIISITFLVLVVALGYSICFKIDKNYVSNNGKILQIPFTKSSTIDAKAQSTFRSIDSSIARINHFLIERGLKQMRLLNAGGPEDDGTVTDINAALEYYNKQIQGVEKILDNTPLGVPAFGAKTSGFGYRPNPFTGESSEMHPGLDFKGDIGDPVKATANGIVIFAGSKGGYGNCVIIQHENNFQTLFGHLSKIKVKENQKIEIGTIIGSIGSTGRSTGPHLHYEIIKNGEKINPVNFLNI